MNANEIMKLFGISKSTLIYYEKKGIIKANRNENNYRIFTVDDIISLLKYKKYQDWDLSITESEKIINSTSLDNLVEGTDLGVDRLNKDYLFSQLKLQYLKNTQKELKLLKYNENCLFTEYIDKLYCTKISRQLFLQNSCEFLNKEKFTKLVKYAGVIKFCYVIPTNGNYGTWYMCIDSSIVDAIEDFSAVYDFVFCDCFVYVTYVKIENSNYEKIFEIENIFREKAQKNNMQINLDYGTICKICGITSTDTYIKMMIPLKKEN